MRPAILNPIFTEVEALKGIGPTLLKPLGRLGIARVIDALFHLPTGVIRRHHVARLDEADVGRTIALTLTAHDYRASGGRGPFRVIAVDGENNHVALVYFGGKPGWAKKLFPLGEPRIVSGKLERYGDWLQIVHPDHVLPVEEAGTLPAQEAVYPLSEGLTNRRMAQLAREAIDRAPELEEWIDAGFLARTARGAVHPEPAEALALGLRPARPERDGLAEERSEGGDKAWPSWRDAIHRAHAEPGDAMARDRLAYDEIFANQLALMLVRAASRRRRGAPLIGDEGLRRRLDLPYAPTGAQRRAIAEIEGDLRQSAPMLRLLQGDVGSGKTLVALMALLMAVEAGAQGALLAPTEILARQHHENLSAMLRGLPVNVAILTGREKGRVREATLMGLADGSIHILVGTHAIFQAGVTYQRLGLVVVDEQHRFGVAQRMMLAAKAQHPPHLLVMTATPIPRTLTLSNYGEMDVSRLDEMPPGRQPIDTRVMSTDRMSEIVDALGRHVDAGAQAYWVCPLVEESETSDQAAAEARYQTLRARFGDRVGLVHGRMKGPDKDRAMEDFASGRIAVLVATTVIEVGVDVPNASLMIIEGAERFGLAQLHQLRGRVGRGSRASVCLLLRGTMLGEVARTRLALLREINDGFRIAEEDLRLRGPGEILGTRQSGEAGFRLATPEQVNRWIATATSDARLLVDQDSRLESGRGQAARVALYLFERDAAVALLRSG